ncbi:MAG: FMN-binding glutamate synthase family protein, partial [Pirellulaceae bacterium]|nr:FMN-binding glutamate synthase family protein [Pirellulaceae bacterium]
FVRDMLQTRHAIIRNFPVIGHIRYMLETIGPEIRQYFVANDKEERPFNRDERRWIYASSKGQNSTFGFGTTEQIYEIGYPVIKHSTFPFPDSKAKYPGDDPTAIPGLKVMGERHGRARCYRPSSIINISAMSFGSLGEKAISALNVGAREANCMHNTGEGGISPYHCLGGELMWQLGTGYFGARKDEHFSMDVLAGQVEKHSQVRCIEIKLSQGAKPGKGGILPGSKVTAEIARIRGIPEGKDCYSPNAHSEFDTVDEMIDFIELLADRTGLPIGIKSAIGQIDFWYELAERMRERREGPDFITIDGAEGGTGAAPLTFSDHVALPFKVGFKRVYQVFQQADLSKEITWIGSAKLGFPDRTMVAMAMGVDLIGIAREAMLAIGCIQAQKCHTGHCPVGVATQSGWWQRGLNVHHKANRFASYIRAFRKELLALAHAAGYEHPQQITSNDIEVCTGVNTFSTLEESLGYKCDRLELSSMEELTPID